MERKKVWYAPYKFESYGEEEINGTTKTQDKEIVHK